MIYFFDNELNMVKVATSKNVISAVHEHELNGLILGTVETDLSYTEAFINDVDYFGYYYKDNYYLHKIKRVEHEHENELVRITGRHIFFEDMLYGDYIRDVRPENRDALYILNQTISANTRWQTVMTDTSKVHSETYYWVPPMEVLNDLTENVGIEYEPKILFDGQNINGFQLHVANRIGEDTPIRVPFGSRVINLKHEVDYSEIVTALYGHGKGEEVGDGYGRRINFSSVNFSRNGVVSPSGQIYMENPNVTAQYGKDDGSPKFGRVIFEDIESASELANATYEAYLEQSRPKMLFEASVVDLGDVGMGDGVLIIRREYDVYFNARIHKLMVDLLDAENADVELGDYAHFKESKVQRKTRESNNQYRRETSSRIQQLKEQFNDRFDGEVNQMREDFEQTLIDAHAEIEAAEQRMTTLIGNERTSLQEEIDGKTNDAREYADSQIADKESQYEADWNQRDADIQQTIETVVGGSMDSLDTSLIDVSSRLTQTNEDLVERINNIDTQSFNLIRGSRFDEPAYFDFWGGAYVVDDEGDIPFVRLGDAPNNIPFVQFFENVQLEEDQQYTLAVEYRTEDVPELDYLRIFPVSGGNSNLITFADNNAPYELQTDGTWNRMIFRFTPTFGVDGGIGIGTNFVSGDETRGVIDIRLPYLTDGNNTHWVFHPSDNYSTIATAMQRLGEFEGRIEDNKAMILGELEDTREDLTQRLSDAQADIDNLNFETRNLLPLVRSAWVDGGIWTNGNLSGHNERLRTAAVGSLTPGEHYTLSDDSAYISAINAVEFFIYNGGVFVERFEIERLGSLSFQATGNEYRIQLTPLPGFSIHLDYMEHPDERIKIKLERGTKRSEFTYAPEDTRHKIIQLDDSFEFIDGELEGMLRRTEIEPINDKITEFETNFEANAETFGLLQEKTELHDENITTWSNLTESTADEVSRVLTRVGETESGLERAETDISMAAGEIEAALSRITVTEDDITEANAAIEANAEGLSALLTRTTEAEDAIADISVDVDGISADFASYKEDVDGEVGALSAQVSSYEASVDGFRAEVGTLSGDIDDVDSWIADKGSVIDGNADAISSKVWMGDFEGVNPNFIPLVESEWEDGGYSTANGFSFSDSSRLRTKRPINVIPGEQYTFRDYSGFVSAIDNIRILEYQDGEYLGYQEISRQSQLTFEAQGNQFRLSLQPVSNTPIRLSFVEHIDGRFKMKLEHGTQSTALLNATSNIEQLAYRINLSVSEMDENMIRKADVTIGDGRVTIGATEIDGDTIGSVLSVSASGINAVAEQMRLTGDLFVKGDVEAWSMAAVKAEFGSLWADEFEAITITGNHIDGNTITGRHLSVDSAMVDKLIADTAFANDIQTLSLSAVRGDVADLRSRILTSDVVTTDHINWNNALFNRLTGDEAFIDRLEVKAANIRDLSAVDFEGNRITQSSGGNHTLEMYNGYLTSRDGGEMNLRFGRYDLEFYNRRTDRTGWIGPIWSDAGGSRYYGIGLTVENDFLTIGIRRQGIIRPLISASLNSRVTSVAGPFSGAVTGASLHLYANRRFVSANTDFQSDFSASDQPSIFMNQGDDANDMTQYFGGANRRRDAEWRVRFNSSSDTWTSRIIADSNSVSLVASTSSSGQTGNRFTKLTAATFENDNGLSWVLQDSPSNGSRLFMGYDYAAIVGGRGAASLWAGGSSDSFIRSMTIRGNTTTFNQDYVQVSTSGTLRRITSSRRYKLDEMPIDLEYARKLLNVDAKTWVDRKSAEKYAEYLETGKELDDDDKDLIKRVPGVIAEDIHDVGLHHFVIYDDVGRPDGINQNLPMLMMPIVKDHESRIETNEEKIKRLEKEIEQLKGA